MICAVMITKQKDINRSVAQGVAQSATLPSYDVIYDAQKEHEKLLLIERKIQPSDCKHLSGEELVSVLLSML